MISLKQLMWQVNAQTVTYAAELQLMGQLHKSLIADAISIPLDTMLYPLQIHWPNAGV